MPFMTLSFLFEIATWNFLLQKWSGITWQTCIWISIIWHVSWSGFPYSLTCVMALFSLLSDMCHGLVFLHCLTYVMVWFSLLSDMCHCLVSPDCLTYVMVWFFPIVWHVLLSDFPYCLTCAMVWLTLLYDMCHGLVFPIVWHMSWSVFPNCLTYVMIWFSHCLTYVIVWFSPLTDMCHGLVFPHCLLLLSFIPIVCLYMLIVIPYLQCAKLLLTFYVLIEF